MLSLSLSLRKGGQKGSLIGVVITASHNPADDNGLKITGPSGSLLSPILEQLIERFVNAHIIQKGPQGGASQGGPHEDNAPDEGPQEGGFHSGEALQAEVDCFFAVAEQLLTQPHLLDDEEGLHEGAPEGGAPEGGAPEGNPKCIDAAAAAAAAASDLPQEQQQQQQQQKQQQVVVRGCVLHARDPRASSAGLEEALVAGLSLLGALSVPLGVAATGQLQFLVLLCNEALRGGPRMLQQQQHEELLAALQPLCKEQQQERQQEQQQEEQLQQLGQRLLAFYFCYFEGHFRALVDILSKDNLLQGNQQQQQQQQ